MFDPDQIVIEVPAVERIQSKPGSGLGFHVEDLKKVQVVLVFDAEPNASTGR